MSIRNDLESLSPETLVELFEFDGSVVGEGRLLWHAGVTVSAQNVVWRGETYTRFPIMADGFAVNGRGVIPRPRMVCSNVGGQLGAYVRSIQDALGVKVIRWRTFAKYLDAANFLGGNPEANPDAHFPKEIYFISRKTGETPVAIEFELSAAWDVAGVMLPRRQVMCSLCPWQYRGDGCDYNGPTVEDANGNPTSDPARDGCQKTLRACRAHFQALAGPGAWLNFGGFPGSLLMGRG